MDTAHRVRYVGKENGKEMGDYSEIVVLLDRSGSMQAARADHEGGLNSFVSDQKALPGQVQFTLIQFDTAQPCEVVVDGLPIRDVGPCTLVPRGGTPLLDAVGLAVAHVRTRLEHQTPEPDLVIFMVITDGQENSSREFTKGRVKQLIEEREKAGWKFLFLGANIDSFAEAGGLGINAASAMDFKNDAAGVKAAYRTLSSNVSASGQSVSRGESRDMAYSHLDFTKEQREQATGKDAPKEEKTPSAKPVKKDWEALSKS